MTAMWRLLAVGAVLAGLGWHGTARAEEITCTTESRHPVCVATFKLHPAGSIRANQFSQGTAVVGGKTVEYRCLTGQMGAGARGRKCTF